GGPRGRHDSAEHLRRWFPMAPPPARLDGLRAARLDAGPRRHRGKSNGMARPRALKNGYFALDARRRGRGSGGELGGYAGSGAGRRPRIRSGGSVRTLPMVLAANLG